MATLDELKDAVRDSLESRGVMGQLKARIRAEIFSALDEPDAEKPPLSKENMIINELIREYLEFNRYKHTLSVMVAETGQPKEPIDRGFLAQELRLMEDGKSRSVPLLYGIVAKLQQSQNPLAAPILPLDISRHPQELEEQIFVKRIPSSRLPEHANPSIEDREDGAEEPRFMVFKS